MTAEMTCAACGAAIPYGAAFCPNCGQPAIRVPAGAPAPPVQPPPVTTQPSAATPAPARSVRYAGFWLRFVAFLIDVFVLTLPTMVLLVFLTAPLGVGRGGPMGGPDAVPAVFLLGEALFVPLLSLVIEWLYFALLESSSWQATVGKRVLGLRVTDTMGRRITFGRATGRFFAKIISRFTLLIGYIMAGFTARKQALHDLIADCLVVRRP